MCRGRTVVLPRSTPKADSPLAVDAVHAAHDHSVDRQPNGLPHLDDIRRSSAALRSLAIINSPLCLTDTTSSPHAERSDVVIPDSEKTVLHCVPWHKKPGLQESRMTHAAYRIGVVGVGRMGANMARRLHELHYPACRRTSNIRFLGVLA